MLNTIRLTVTSPSRTFTHTALGASVKIGRSLKCEFSIPLEDLSREHCLFESEGEQYSITDLGSSNGVWVDRERIPPHKKIQVTGESLIVLSNLYTLKINAVEIRTKSNVTVTPLKEVNPDQETITFQLEFPDEKKESTTTNKRLKLWKSKNKNEKSVEKETHEITKMIVGFLVITAFIIYHFLKI